MRFPSGFLWSTATAAHQVEGGNVNSDSWLYEHVPGTIYAEPSGDGCDHYHRYPQDISLLADLKSRGLSILFITHDLSLGYYISERAVILYRGHVVEMGATEKLYDNPLHPYTEMLMASVPRLDRKWEEVEVELRAIQAELSKGCVYYERCPAAYRSEGCERQRPMLIESVAQNDIVGKVTL